MLLHIADKERERDQCQYKEEKRLDSRVAWASLRLLEKPLVWDQPSLNNCAPTVYSWLQWLAAGGGQGQNLGKYLAHAAVIVSQGRSRTAGEGGTCDVTDARFRHRGSILWQLMLSAWDLRTNMSGTTWHWCMTSKHCPGTGGGGVLAPALNQHQQRAASPKLGALQTFLKVTLPSTAVTEHSKDVFYFRGIIPWVTPGFFLIE